MELDVAAELPLQGFERIGRGALLLDEDGRIVAMNARVPLDDGLRIVRGRLVAEQLADNVKLQHCCHWPLGTSDGLARTLLITRPSGRVPLLIHAVRVSGLVLLLVTEATRAPRVPPVLLESLFGLTPKEAQLAAHLAAGLSLTATAQALSITAAHARQRLKTVFGKTGTRRQAELTALLARLD